MALSAKAQKALEEVKMGLSILYGADYFTEEEWIKIDGLIHKGRYVLTHGPPTNVLEEQLMSFEESNEAKKPLPKENSRPHKEETVVAPEQTSPPSSSNGDLTSHVGTPNETSAEASSDEETSPASSLSAPPMFDFSESTTPVSAIPAESKPRIPPGFTQEQIDEAKKLAAGMTKAGQKKREIHPLIDEYPSSSCTDDPAETTRQSHCSSPAPTECEARISSWASEVDAADSAERHHPVALLPQKTIMPDVLLEQFVKAHQRLPQSTNDFYQPNNPQFNPRRPGSVASVKTTRKASKYSPQRAPSVVAATGNTPIPKLNVKPGTVLRAQQKSLKTGGILLDVEIKDPIKILKHVSGITHMGENMRTKKKGHFLETIFQKPAGAALVTQQQELVKNAADGVTVEQNEAERRHKELDAVERNAAEWDEVHSRHSRTPVPVAHTGLDAVERVNVAEWSEIPSKAEASGTMENADEIRVCLPIPATPTTPAAALDVMENNNATGWDEVPTHPSKTLAQIPSVALDAVESMNAAEWDEVPARRSKNVVPAAAPVAPKGMAASRFSILEDLESKAAMKERSITPAMENEFRKIIDNKVDEILKLRAMAAPTPAFKNQPSLQKTAICWWWVTPGKECRYTDEECGNAHTLIPGATIGLKYGKPSWGAAADYIPSESSTSIAADSDPRYKTKTCYYWAVEGKCNYSTEDCKYLHAHAGAGIAAKPAFRTTPKHWRIDSWKKSESDGDDGGELVLDEVRDEGSTWGDANAWGKDDKYKPPHIVALKNKALQQTVGW